MGFTVIGPNAHEVNAEAIQLIRPAAGMSPEEFDELAPKVLVAILHRKEEGIHAVLSSNIGIWAKLNTPVATIADMFGGFIDMTRAGVARTFLQYCNDRQGVEYIVMMDNDEAVPWDAPYRLAQWGKDIVSGVVCSFSVKKGGVFACFTMADKYGSSRFPSVKHTKRMPAKGLVEAVHAGTGLLCVHRRVFEAIFASGEYPFMISEEVRRHCAATGSLTLGEDMTFSEQAKRCGFKTYVDLSVKVDHYKTMIVRWPEDQVDPSLDSREWRVSDDDFTIQQ